MISVITIGLNNKHEIVSTISSADNHMVSEKIIIVGDNHLANELKNLYVKEKKIQVYYLEPEGIYHAMNFGVLKASKKFLIFMNSGDHFVEGVDLSKLEEQKVYLFSYQDQAGVHYPKKVTSKIISMPTSHQSMIYDSSFCKNIPFDENYKFAADFAHLIALRDRNVQFIYSDNILSENSPRGSAKYAYSVYREYKHILKEISLFRRFLLVLKFLRIQAKYYFKSGF